MSIRVEGLTKRFGDFLAVDNVSLTVEPGELVAFLGPSGGGKSTILRIIAGLEQADAGAVFFDRQPADHLHPSARGVGFVFQHYALFRHMTVADNIAFGLRVQGASRQRQAERATELLGLMGLQGLGHRYPNQLSGGQRQRVALARALAPEPKVLLLDEPFGAVDAKVREELRHWLRKLHDEVHVTSIFVTHDQEEAFSVADQVMVINRGRLEQAGTPNEILDDPGTEFVARFIGEANVFETTVAGGAGPGRRLEHPGGRGGRRDPGVHRRPLLRPQILARRCRLRAGGAHDHPGRPGQGRGPDRRGRPHLLPVPPPQQPVARHRARLPHPHRGDPVARLRDRGPGRCHRDQQPDHDGSTPVVIR